MELQRRDSIGSRYATLSFCMIAVLAVCGGIVSINGRASDSRTNAKLECSLRRARSPGISGIF
jgi:hypothetical protein